MEKIRLSKSCLSNKEISAVNAVMRNEFLGMGTQVKEFEILLKDYLETDMHVVCVNTGTSALLLALSSIGIKPGDEVLVPSLTYVASFQAISALGAIPIACDIQSDSLFLDVNDAESRITERTKAIMPVHYAGSSEGISDVYEMSNKYGFHVIEDAAHSFGGDGIGQSGDVICFSFDGIKNITSAEGGAILTNDEVLARRLRDERLLGVIGDSKKRFSGKRSWEFDVEHQGYRFHMSNINAAIGIEQLKRLPKFSEKRRRIAKVYLDELSSIPGISFPSFNFDAIVPHIFVIKAHYRDELRHYLASENIETGVQYRPNHLLTKYRCDYDLVNTEKAYTQIISLPCHPDLSETDLGYVTSKIKYFYMKNLFLK